MTSPLSEATLADLMSWVKIQFAWTGELQLLQFPTSRELLRAVSACGGNKISNELDDIRAQLDAYVYKHLPAIRQQAQPKGRWLMAKEIVLQRASHGRYASPLLHGRYQVLEHPVVSGQFNIIDLELLGDDWRKDWQATLHHPARGGSRPDAIDFPTKEAAFAKVEELVRGDSAPRPRAAKPAADPAKAWAEPRKSTPRAKKESMAGMVRRLLQAGHTDEEVQAMVSAEHPNLRATTVAWYRKEMSAKA